MPYSYEDEYGNYALTDITNHALNYIENQDYDYDDYKEFNDNSFNKVFQEIGASLDNALDFYGQDSAQLQSQDMAHLLKTLSTAVIDELFEDFSNFGSEFFPMLNYNPGTEEANDAVSEEDRSGSGSSSSSRFFTDNEAENRALDELNQFKDSAQSLPNGDLKDNIIGSQDLDDLEDVSDILADKSEEMTEEIENYQDVITQAMEDNNYLLAWYYLQQLSALKEQKEQIDDLLNYANEILGKDQVENSSGSSGYNEDRGREQTDSRESKDDNDDDDFNYDDFKRDYIDNEGQSSKEDDSQGGEDNNDDDSNNDDDNHGEHVDKDDNAADDHDDDNDSDFNYDDFKRDYIDNRKNDSDTGAETGSSANMDGPEGDFDRESLDTWNLGTVYENEETGNALHIQDPTSYKDENFYVDEDGYLNMKAGVEGARTSSGTDYTRTELRELDENGDKAAWKLGPGERTLDVTMHVDEVATKSTGEEGRLIVGQIHGEDDELARLYYDNGTMYFENEIAYETGDEERFELLNADGETPDIEKGEDFRYQISADEDYLTVTLYADGEEYSGRSRIHDDWMEDEFYFKAGVYNNVSDENGHKNEGSGFSQASFKSIELY